MTRSLAIALAPYIRVNSISPRAVDTRWWSGNQEKNVSACGKFTT